MLFVTYFVPHSLDDCTIATSKFYSLLFLFPPTTKVSFIPKVAEMVYIGCTHVYIFTCNSLDHIKSCLTGKKKMSIVEGEVVYSISIIKEKMKKAGKTITETTAKNKRKRIILY
jgi:hypothetical protein